MTIIKMSNTIYFPGPFHARVWNPAVSQHVEQDDGIRSRWERARLMQGYPHGQAEV